MSPSYRRELSAGGSTWKFLTAAATTWQTLVSGLPRVRWNLYARAAAARQESPTTKTAAGMVRPSSQP
jgi:hypothetical protein